MKITAFLVAALALSTACSETSDPEPSQGTGGRGGAGGPGGGSAGIEPMCDVPCGDACCGIGDVCLEPPLATPSTCARECVANSWCTDASAPCCALLPDGSGACTADDSPLHVCRCAGDNDCPDGTCAPYYQDGEPQGPNVCVPFDGAPYHGCAANLPCGEGYCCLELGSSHFCALECETDADCGTANLRCSVDLLGGGCSGCVPR
jgi:hypothetical protein